MTIFESNDYMDVRDRIINNNDFTTRNKNKLLWLLSSCEKDWLTKQEIEFLETQMDYQEELIQLRELYKKNMADLWIKTTIDLSRTFNNLENDLTVITRNDLNNLYLDIQKNISLNNRSDVLWLSISRTFRDFIKNNIDFRWNLENVSEDDFMKDYLNIFAINYRKKIESRDNKNLPNFDLIWLNLSEKELFDLINDTNNEIFNQEYKTQDNNIVKKYWDNISYTAIFKLVDWSQVIQEISRKNYLEYKEDVYTWLEPWLYILKGSETEKGKIKLSEKDTNSKDDKKQKKVEKSKENKQEKVIISTKKEKVIVKKEIKVVSLSSLLKQENKDGFLLSDFLDRNWIPEPIYNIFVALLNTYLQENKDLLNKKNKTITLTNLREFLDFILKVESYWWKNAINKSWAKGYYQLHTWNAKKWYGIFVDGDLQKN